MNRDTIERFAEKIDQLDRIARELFKDSEDFPAVHRNTKRILASVEMLRLNIPDSAWNEYPEG